MTQLEDQIRDLYRQASDAEQPPAKVSIVEALRRGRLARRWRRFAAAAAPVVTAAAVAVTMLAATPPAHDHRTAPAKPPIPDWVPPALFNPLAVNISFGWLPPGEAAVSGATGDLNGWLSVNQVRNPSSSHSPNGNTRWRLSDFALGSNCTLASGDRRLLCDGQRFLSGAAPEINGHSAFWESGYWPHQALVWTFAPGFWAELTSTAGFRQSDQTLLRIAQNAVIGARASQPVKFAVQLTGVPSGWRIGSTFVTRVSGSWLVGNSTVTTAEHLLWAGASWPVNRLPAVTTNVAGGSCNQFGYFNFNQANRLTINGYHVETVTVRHKHVAPFFMLCAPHANGLLVLEQLSGAYAPVSVTTLFEHMRLLGPKPSAWTTRPIS